MWAAFAAGDARSADSTIRSGEAPQVSPRAADGKSIPGGDGPSPTVVAQAVVVLYAVRANGQIFGDAYLLRLPDGRLCVRRLDLEGWRLRIPAGRPVLYRTEEYVPLDAFPGITYEVDEPRQELSLEIPPRHFTETLVEGMPNRFVQPTLPGVGGFGNYDFFYSASPEKKRLDGQLEVGLFNAMGVGIGGFLATDLGEQRRLIRLDSTWTRDFPGEARTLVIGDAVGTNGIWGRAVRYGGIRYGTNFATTPGLVTMPLPSLRGESALPTTAELYIDGVLRQSTGLSPGPFRLDNLPVVSGQGEVQLVVRDLLGREQVITQAYYASSLLLRSGLTDDSYEVGAERSHFGTRSNDYGRLFAVAQFRKGFSDNVTGEARLELLRDQQTAGLGGAVALENVGVVTGAVALSHGPHGQGRLASIGFERQVRRYVSFGLRSQWTSEDFTQLGLESRQRAPLRVTSGNIGMAAAGYGSLGIGYARQDYRDHLHKEVASASYGISIARSTSLIVSAFRSLAGDHAQSYSVTLSMGFGERSSASVARTGQASASQSTVQVQQNLPGGSGTGYRVLAGTDANGGRTEAGLFLQTRSGTYMVEAGRIARLNAYRASASGAVGVVDGRAFLSRRLSESFGVAHVPGFSNVAVYVNNQMVGSTDAEGYAVLPVLLAYQANPVRIETEDLPFDAQIDAVSMDVIPFFRSGAAVRFPVQPSHGALLTVVLENGTPMPLGSLARIVGRDGEFPVAQRGEVYVVGLGEKSRLSLTWRGQACEFDIEMNKELGPLPKIGPFTCKGVSR